MMPNPHTWHRPPTRAEMRGERIQDLMHHPVALLVIALGIGLLLGALVTDWSLRYTKLAAGLLFLFVLIRFQVHIGVGLFLIVYAFPTGIQLGNTNLIVPAVIAAIWLVKVRLRLAEPWHRTYIDWAIGAYIAAHLLAFLNVTSLEHFEGCLSIMRYMTAPILFFYVFISVGRSESRLHFLTEMLLLGQMFVFFTAFMEQYAPGFAFLPKNLLTGFGAGGLFTEPGVRRIGGVFTQNLLADTTAITMILRIYLALYYRHHQWMRVYHLVALMISVYVLSLAGNRGGLVLFLAGSTYFFVLFNKELSLRRVLAGLLLTATILLIGEMTVAQFEGEGSLLGRLFATKLDRGIPDTRRAAWTFIWAQIMERPILGHGPYFDPRWIIRGHRAIWPHNAFLFYMYTIGIVGLPTFLVLVIRLVKHSWAGHGYAVANLSLAHGLSVVFHINLLQWLGSQLRSDHQRGDTGIFFMWFIFCFVILSQAVWRERRKNQAGMNPHASRGTADAGAVAHVR